MSRSAQGSGFVVTPLLTVILGDVVKGGPAAAASLDELLRALDHDGTSGIFHMSFLRQEAVVDRVLEIFNKSYRQNEDSPATKSFVELLTQMSTCPARPGEDPAKVEHVKLRIQEFLEQYHEEHAPRGGCTIC